MENIEATDTDKILEDVFTPTKKVKYEDMTPNEQMFIRQLDAIRLLSPAQKRQVGAIIGDPVTGRMYTVGYNRMFDSMPSPRCEDTDGQTIPYVIHAEELAAISYMKHGFDADTSKLTMYVSYAPCLFCSKMTSHMGVHRLVFVEKHAHKFDVGRHSPRAFLDTMGFEVLQVVETPKL